MLRRWFVAALPAAALTAALACAEPTALVVEVHSEVPCSANAQVAVYGARSASELANRAPSAFATKCELDGAGSVSRGSIVLTPTGAKDETLVFAVVSRDDATPVDTGCAPGSPTLDHCIVARRQITFLPRTTLTMRVDLRLSCLGVACGASETCVRGKCVASLVDVAACQVACDEANVGGTPVDAGVVETGAPDAPYDSGSVPNPCPQGKVLLGEFATWSGKVNVHRSVSETGVGAPWAVDVDCTSGANVNTITYCKKFWPASATLVPYAKPTTELKPFTEAGSPPTCGKLWPDPGLAQFGCCSP